MPVGARRTATKMSVMAKLSELTLTNFNNVINQLGVLAAGTGYQTMDIPVTASYAQPVYTALMIIGPGPLLASGQTGGRMVIVRKVLSQVKAQLAWDKKTQQAYDCTFVAYYVSGSITPVHIATEEE